MRGQAALEYLTTYGWAFMVLLVMIGGLTYMGVTNTDTLIPERCQVPAEFSCEDFSVQTDSVSIILKNNMKGTVYVSKLNITYNAVYAGDDCGVLQPVGGTPPLNQFYTLNPGEKVEAVCTTAPPFDIVAGDKVKMDFEFVYKKTSAGFEHQLVGEIVAGVSG